MAFNLKEAFARFSDSVSNVRGAQKKMVCNASLVLMRGGNARNVREAMAEEISWSSKALTMAKNFATVEVGNVEALTIAKAEAHMVEAWDAALASAGTINAMYSRLSDDFTGREANGIKVVETCASSLASFASQFVETGERLVSVEHDGGPRLLKAAREATNTSEALTVGLAKVTIAEREQDNLATLATLTARGEATHGLMEAIAEAAHADPSEPEASEPEASEPEASETPDPVEGLYALLTTFRHNSDVLDTVAAMVAEFKADIATAADAAAAASEKAAA